jgi:hypothetical protein
MSTSDGKGSRPRPVKGDHYRYRYDEIFRKPIHRAEAQTATPGMIVDGHRKLGPGCWQSVDQQEPTLRDNQP